MQRDAYTQSRQRRPQRNSEEESLSRGADSQAETSMCAHLGGTTTREAVFVLSYKASTCSLEGEHSRHLKQSWLTW